MWYRWCKWNVNKEDKIRKKTRSINQKNINHFTFGQSSLPTAFSHFRKSFPSTCTDASFPLQQDAPRGFAGTAVGSLFGNVAFWEECFRERDCWFACRAFREAQFVLIRLKPCDWVQGLGLGEWWFWRIFLWVGFRARPASSWKFLPSTKTTYLIFIYCRDALDQPATGWVISSAPPSYCPSLSSASGFPLSA